MTSTRERLPRRLGPYELTERLGAGGMGAVYRATDRRLGTTAAVKVIHAHLRNEPGYVERFRREAHVASLLTSPYIVHVIEFGVDRGVYYLATEFVEGVRLSEVIASGPLPPEQALSVAVQVALGLAEADIRGVIHRDIKPENIIITSDNAVKLMDFGVARLNYTRGVTEPGLFVGTVATAAPEQFRGEVDIRSDIYALGVVLFRMLSGEPPFQAETIGELIRLHEVAPPPLAKLSHLPQPLVDVVARCLKKNPSDRFQKPSELLAAMDKARESLSSSEPADTWIADATAVLANTGVSPAGSSGISASDATVLAARRVETRPAASSPNDKPPWLLPAVLAILLIVAVGVAATLLLGGSDDARTVTADSSDTGGAVSGTEIAPRNAPAAVVTAPSFVPMFSIFGFSDAITATTDPPGNTVANNAALRSCNPNTLYVWVDFSGVQPPRTFVGRWFRGGTLFNETSFSQTLAAGRMLWSVGAPLPPAQYSFQLLQAGIVVVEGRLALNC